MWCHKNSVATKIYMKPNIWIINTLRRCVIVSSGALGLQNICLKMFRRVSTLCLSDPPHNGRKQTPQTVELIYTSSRCLGSCTLPVGKYQMSLWITRVAQRVKTGCCGASPGKQIKVSSLEDEKHLVGRERINTTKDQNYLLACWVVRESEAKEGLALGQITATCCVFFFFLFYSEQTLPHTCLLIHPHVARPAVLRV